MNVTVAVRPITRCTLHQIILLVTKTSYEPILKTKSYCVAGVPFARLGVTVRVAVI